MISTKTPHAIPGTIRRSGIRLAAVGLVAVLGVGGVAACGQADLKKQADTAGANFASSKVASFTLRLDDPKGSLAKAATTSGDKKAMGILAESAITITVDPAGDATVGSSVTSPAPAPKDPVAALKASGAVDITYTHDGKPVVDFRMINGVIYVRLDRGQIKAISGQDLPLDGMTGPGAPAGFSKAVAGLKAGKWLSLNLPAVYTKLMKALKSSGLPGVAASPLEANGASASKLQDLGRRLMTAVTANTTTTEVVGSDGQVVVSFHVKAKPALSDVLDAVAASGLPGFDAPSIAKAKKELTLASNGTIDGTLTIKDDHFTRFALDLHSLAALDKKAAAKDLASTVGTQLVVDINDNAPAVTAPAKRDVVSVDAAVNSFIAEFAGEMTGLRIGKMPGHKIPGAPGLKA